MDNVKERMQELALPIETQILMCDNRKELLIMACIMMKPAREIFDQEIAESGRKLMFKDLV